MLILLILFSLIIDDIEKGYKNKKLRIIICKIRNYRRFNIINCSLESIKKNIFNVPEFLASGSYNIGIFHNQISAHKLKEPIYYEIDFIKINKDDKDHHK